MLAGKRLHKKEADPMTDHETSHIGIDYERLVEDALRSVVYKSLKIVEATGLPGETHFYISFMTTYPSVQMDDAVFAKHPETMTIVLQHQYADLDVGDASFSITLFFNGKPSPMIIPYDAITSFNDPSVGFGLQFGMLDDDEQDEADDEVIISGDGDSKKRPNSTTSDDDNASGASADVVSLDNFRKRPTK